MTSPPLYGGTETPYGAGVAAYRAGQPETDNPHQPGRIQGDVYPGAHVLWQWGWLHARHVHRHSLQTLQR